jgi:hypothetical protein
MAQDTGDLDDAARGGIGTWAVPAIQAPAVAHFMHDALPNESYDPHFLGQVLETTYFDTPGFALRKARIKSEQYLTLRLRCYQAPGSEEESYALSAKTEFEKWRQPIDPDDAHNILTMPALIATFLPANILARYLALVGNEPLIQAVTVCCRRYAVESPSDRWTLDMGVHTDTGKCLECGVLEYKSTDSGSRPPGAFTAIGLHRVRLSKFLWATDWRS